MRNSLRTGERLFAFLCWLVLLPAVAVLATAAFIHVEHRTAADRRYELADEQRSIAAAAVKLVEDIARGPVPAVSRVSALRARSLELLALVPLRATADLPAEWGRLAASLGAIEAEWARILAFRTGLEALRRETRILREDSERLAEALSAGDAVVRGGAEALAIASRELSEEAGRVRLADPAGLDRVRSLLAVHARVQGFLAAEIARTPTLAAPRAEGAPAPDADPTAVGAPLGAARERLEAVLGMAGELGAVSGEIRGLVASSARVVDLLPGFEARGRQSPVVLGASTDAWLVRSGLLALAALIGLSWRRRRLLRARAAELAQARSEAGRSDRRARGLVGDLLRAIDSLDRTGAARGAPADHGEIEGQVREAAASLPRIVARRSRLAAALLSAHDSLRERLAAARDSVLAHLGRTGSGEFDPAPLLKIEAAFRQTTLFAMAALAAEIRAAASEPGTTTAAEGAEPPDGEAAEAAPAARAAGGPATIQDTAARAFDLLDAGLERVLAGEEEGNAAFIFLLDDLKTVRGMALFSSSLDFDPDLASPMEAGSSRGAVLRSDAVRMLPSFRKGFEEWTAGEGSADSAAKLVRGSVSVLARSAEEGMSPARGFWSAAAAFCTALCEYAIPDGPTVRRIMGEVAGEFEEAAEREEASTPPERLLRELLFYVALAESDHEELQGVRTAFKLERRPLAVPAPAVETEAGGDDPPAGGPPDEVSEEIIQQLEGIKAALDRIDGPSETSPEPPPARRPAARPAGDGG